MHRAGAPVSGRRSDSPPRHRKPAHADLLLDPFGMMYHFEVAVELPVFVIQRIVAMRAGRDDFFDAERLPRFDVFHGDGLVVVFFADAPRRISAAFFIFSKDADGEPGRLEQRRERSGHLYVTLIESARTPDVPEVLVAVELRDVKIFGPFTTGRASEPPGVRIVLQVFQDELNFRGEITFHENEKTPHVDDFRSMLDAHRADFLAGLAGCARP